MFGLVGEKQAALYYSVCLLFTVFFFKNSGLRHSLMSIARTNSHGKSPAWVPRLASLQEPTAVLHATGYPGSGN